MFLVLILIIYFGLSFGKLESNSLKERAYVKMIIREKSKHCLYREIKYKEIAKGKTN